MFTVSKSSLLDALKMVGQIVERRTTIPVLQNVLIDRWGTSGKLTARVTNLDLEATVPFSATVATDFKPFTVPGHMLLEIIRKLPDGADIEITDRDGTLNQIVLKAGRSKFQLQVLPATDFPALDANDLPFVVEVPSKALAPAMDRVAFAISTEETRYYLNGIFFHAAPDGVKLVATDGHRLAKQFIAIENVPQDMPGIIIPKKTVETLSKHLPKDAPIVLQVSDAKIRILIDDMVIVSKLIDGTFPDYQRVVPNYSGGIDIEGKPLAAAIDRVSTVSSERGRAVKMSFSQGTLRLTVSNPDAGEAEDSVSYDGEIELETGFNAKYVNEALSHLSDGSVQMQLGDAGSPAILRADGDHVENLIVLMPMRV